MQQIDRAQVYVPSISAFIGFMPPNASEKLPHLGSKKSQKMNPAVKCHEFKLLNGLATICASESPAANVFAMTIIFKAPSGAFGSKAIKMPFLLCAANHNAGTTKTYLNACLHQMVQVNTSLHRGSLEHNLQSAQQILPLKVYKHCWNKMQNRATKRGWCQKLLDYIKAWSDKEPCLASVSSKEWGNFAILAENLEKLISLVSNNPIFPSTEVEAIHNSCEAIYNIAINELGPLHKAIEDDIGGNFTHTYHSMFFYHPQI